MHPWHDPKHADIHVPAHAPEQPLTHEVSQLPIHDISQPVQELLVAIIILPSIM